MHAAIITGVSGGLGEALAAQLLTRGWTVIGVGRKSAARLRGERYRFVNADLADVDAIEGKLSPPLTELATSSPSTVVCVNNAAVAGPIGIGGRIPHREIAASFAVNLAAPAAIANVFCRIFTDARQDRRIVNISSGAAQTPLPGSALYCAAKSGLEMMTRTLATEWRTPCGKPRTAWITSFVPARASLNFTCRAVPVSRFWTHGTTRT